MSLILVGVATRYAEPMGSPLYCDQFMGNAGTLVYRDTGLPFVALPPDAYGRLVMPGDLVWLVYPEADAEPLLAQALDAGPFGPGTGLYVEDWGRRPIVADVPSHWATWPWLSTPVWVYRVEALAR